MAVVVRGAVLQMLTAFSEPGLSCLFSKLAPNENQFRFFKSLGDDCSGDTRIGFLSEDESPPAEPALLAQIRSLKSILFRFQQA